MPDINLSLIQQRLQEELAKEYSSDYTPDDVLAVALSGVNFNETNVIVTDSIDTLPSLVYNTYPSGMVYFIKSIGIFAINSNNKWLTLDGTTLRTDTGVNLVWTWGYNEAGQLGDNTTTSRSSPVIVVGGFTDWCQVSAGGHSLAVRQNGTAWAWGRNGTGQLGDDTIVSKLSPASVVGGFTDWCQVSASGHSLAVRQNGTAWAWGRNGTGQLGDDTIVSKLSPASVVGGFTDWCQVSAAYHSLAVRQNGTAWAWGVNYSGHLGDNSTTDRSSPVSVVGGFTDWCQVSAGGYGAHSLAVRQNGTAWAWGYNGFGRLGDNSITDKSSPVSVVGGFTDWCQISAGTAFSLALRQNGTAWAWGSNTNGQLGDNSVTSRSSPVSIVGGFTDWCQVSSGRYYHSLAVRQNGTAWAWGYNGSGQLGDTSTTDKSSPVSVVGGFTDWCQISAAYHSLGLRSRQ